MGTALAPATTLTLEQLYPLKADPESKVITQSVLSGESDIDGKPILFRALVPAEKTYLQERRNELSKHLSGARDSEIRRAVSRLLSGFQPGKTGEAQQMAETIAQYIRALRGLPLWAIERACLKFARGEITADEIEGVNRGFGPSSAQLYQIASGLVGEFHRENRDVYRALTGVVEYKPTPEERERIARGLRELAEEMHAKQALEDDTRRAKHNTFRPLNNAELAEIYGGGLSLEERHRLGREIQTNKREGERNANSENERAAADQ